ncbi:bifunctional 2-polyprenyl-6-hydroxyphenol methylase/3-demethylubiquinol 3-O-methyltransferase UbiG [Phenylobacterium sp.]|uniref:class I SAM-dependent methyltransferase n=1 Tax=Phenylobacterium sp. TaxID=1871053 RepID=UPI0027337BDD|nr:class I SAM-dependent methyltransferase [Phenylobacterium sp.]MDP3852847.1 class I SAM-dependent methyltransferase [Phenylobacterium sp.]
MPGIDEAPLALAQKASFDQVAATYAAVRPGYPAVLYDDLTRLGALTRHGRVLEVGCGGGQATGDLAARARHVTALDPGARLVDEARRRVAADNVEFVVARFEDYAPDFEGFDLVASAQAWHWIPREIAFSKAAEALAPGGWLAVFGHVPLPVAGPFEAPFKAAFDRHAPGVWGQPPPQAAYLPSGPFTGMFAGSALFGPAMHRAYPWTWDLDPETLGRYLRTDSSYHFLVEQSRFALFDAMADAVAANGGAFPSPWETHLYVACKL